MGIDNVIPWPKIEFPYTFGICKNCNRVTGEILELPVTVVCRYCKTENKHNYKDK